MYALLKLHWHQSQNTNTDGRGGYVEGKKDDGFMSVSGNTHLEATNSLPCFVVVWRGIRRCNSCITAAQTKLSN